MVEGVLHRPGFTVVVTAFPHHIGGRAGGGVTTQAVAIDGGGNEGAVGECRNGSIAIAHILGAVGRTFARTLENHHIIAPSATVVGGAAEHHVDIVGDIVDVFLARIAQCHERSVGSLGNGGNAVIFGVVD